ncbi:CoB--CoM heterodisulfide reductase iron-sulfur subunit A family protein [Planktothrix sp. FACHB-1355]|uniref:CoB--CoM heterodisulfide reductase iron-sulfur subunit A family protein n=1 Tax=Aerosakkonema funiforme FACHB-1375 TaxID=2949571 RepID=A0A926ZFE7_9CYAN|nr:MULTISPECIES: FAD-dependent oxidoreductase [Oscillatoriales]MBD2180007.1 CoB--CoM heterodisulfide reductase iron-sulfur subunit A family protein [Aerosakkonema funiforme FACHB-1375]MBD3560380.1 CoB--CoM heterodisulfide reductase iron-sulfur subunit A family protein [Planktothrix sp. FACHB-1355]
MGKSVVVIGGGPAGMAAAGKLQDFGYDVVLIEKKAEVGGHLNKWYKVFPDFTDASEIVANLKQALGKTRIVNNATVTRIEGAAPNFKVTVSTGEEIDAGAILVSTGFKHFDATFKEEYGYGIYDNCITSVELDAMLKAQSVKTRNGKAPKKVAMVHCVGSRDEKVNNNYCSRVCCTNGIKVAIEIKQQNPECEIYCLYMDIRVFGRGYEELYRTSQQEYAVQFLRGRLSEAGEKNDGSLLLRLEDTLTAKPMRLTVDLLVLMVGMEGNAELADVAGLSVGCDRFYATAHQQYANNASTRRGIFLAGAATGPKAIMESITDGRSAAAEIASFLASDRAIFVPSLNEQLHLTKV